MVHRRRWLRDHLEPRLRVGPDDATGNIALHVWIVLLLVCGSVAPTAAFVVWSRLSGEPGLVAVRQVFRAEKQDGVLAWIERTTLRGEQEVHARKRTERAERLAAVRR